jgi:hypothetical protein
MKSSEGSTIAFSGFEIRDGFLPAISLTTFVRRYTNDLLVFFYRNFLKQRFTLSPCLFLRIIDMGMAEPLINLSRNGRCCY